MIKTIIVSAVNFTEGGPLTILKECLSSLSNLVRKTKEFRVIAFVYDKNLCFLPEIEYIEIKGAKKSWLYRLYVEFIYFYKFSKKVNPYLWFSLHDITPNVKSQKRVVYFHNPSPFYELKIKDIYFSYQVFVFTLLYKYLYKINSKKNDFIVVQQDWLRDGFSKLIDMDKKKIIVAYPKQNTQQNVKNPFLNKLNLEYQFFYPAFPRPFKNFEIIGEAAIILEAKKVTGFNIFITIDGSENNYSKWIYNKYKHLNTISFIGLLDRKDVELFYKRTDCLLFPSQLETWGLPISEFSIYNKPILAANLPYSIETSSGAKFVEFFEPFNAEDLALKMEMLIKGDRSGLSEIPNKEIMEPNFRSWDTLFDFLLDDSKFEK